MRQPRDPWAAWAYRNHRRLLPHEDNEVDCKREVDDKPAPADKPTPTIVPAALARAHKKAGR